MIRRVLVLTLLLAALLVGCDRLVELSPAMNSPEPDVLASPDADVDADLSGIDGAGDAVPDAADPVADASID